MAKKVNKKQISKDRQRLDALYSRGPIKESISFKKEETPKVPVAAKVPVAKKAIKKASTKK
jgi:hypothetical protein